MHENTTEEHILIFKTNIRRKSDVESLATLLDAHSHIIRWNVDTSDIDKVLRIEATQPDCTPVIALVTNAGFACEELLD